MNGTIPLPQEGIADDLGLRSTKLIFVDNGQLDSTTILDLFNQVYVCMPLAI